MLPSSQLYVSSIFVGLFLISLYCATQLWRSKQLLKSKLDRMSKLREEERKGRTKAEKLLRSHPNLNQDTDSTVNPSLMPITFRSIGTFHGPYNNRRGTPRQGVLVPSAVGYIEFSPWIQCQSTMDGLIGNFSHVWVIWHFHENTNSIQQHLLSQNAHSNQNLGCKAKIKPPRLNGSKVGIFACRTPHRPNAIGLSKCKIIKMDFECNRLFLSDIDMMNGTPIIDIKPYIPYTDIQSDAIIPEWCHNRPDIHSDHSLLFDRVAWKESVVALLSQSAYFSEYFNGDLNAFKLMFEEILIRDIRSLYQRKSSHEHDSNKLFECNLCDLLLKYKINDSEKTVFIVEAYLSGADSLQSRPN